MRDTHNVRAIPTPCPRVVNPEMLPHVRPCSPSTVILFHLIELIPETQIHRLPVFSLIVSHILNSIHHPKTSNECTVATGHFFTLLKTLFSLVHLSPLSMSSLMCSTADDQPPSFCPCHPTSFRHCVWSCEHVWHVKGRLAGIDGI